MGIKPKQNLTWSQPWGLQYGGMVVRNGHLKCNVISISVNARTTAVAPLEEAPTQSVCAHVQGRLPGEAMAKLRFNRL